jgi:hypothetical protein
MPLNYLNGAVCSDIKPCFLAGHDSFRLRSVTVLHKIESISTDIYARVVTS